MTKITVTVDPTTNSTFEALNLPNTEEQISLLAGRADEVIENFLKVVNGELPSEGEGSYNRNHFLAEIAEKLSQEEILLLAMAQLEDVAICKAKASASKQAMQKLTDALKESMREAGFDVDAMSEDIKKLHAEGKSRTDIIAYMEANKAKYGAETPADLEDCKAE